MCITRLVIAVLLISGFLAAQEVKTNLQFAEEALADISDSLINTFKSKNGELGIQSGSGGQGELQLLESVFLQRCANAKVLVRIDDPEVLLQIELVDIKIIYEKTRSNTIGYDDKLHRNLKVTVAGWVEDKSKNQKIPLKISKEKSDLINIREINIIETDHYSFESGNKQPGSTWKYLVEPAIVIGSVAVIIFLFFSQRS